MYKNHKICVIVTAYNEELLISQTIETIPHFVDNIVVVDDCSTDTTTKIIAKFEMEKNRVIHIRHEKNLGVGAAVRTGYLWCKDNNLDIGIVMNGDAQMDPNDIINLINPIINGSADYTKGNRLVTKEAWKNIPHIRYLGNSFLTFMTKIASGYWHVMDSQSGFTAINKKALQILPIENIFPRYGVPNDILVTLNIYDMTMMNIPVKPIYGIGEKSNMKIHFVSFSIFFLLIRSFARRMIRKYILQGFHPLVFFYLLGFSMLLLDIPLIIRFFIRWYMVGLIPTINSIAILFCTFIGLQSLLFAILFDMEDNRRLGGENH